MHIEQLLKCIAMCEFKGGKIDKYKWPCWIYTKDPISSMMSHEVGNISCNCDCKFYSLASHSVSNDHCLRLLDTTIWSKYCEGGILAAWDRNVERSNQDVEKKQTAGWQLRTNLTTSICRVFSVCTDRDGWPGQASTKHEIKSWAWSLTLILLQKDKEQREASKL